MRATKLRKISKLYRTRIVHLENPANAERTRCGNIIADMYLPLLVTKEGSNDTKLSLYRCRVCKVCARSREAKK